MSVSAEPQGVAATNAAAAIRRRLVRGSMTVFVGMVAGTILTLVFNAMLARMVSHATLGAYFLVSSMVVIASTIGKLGLEKTVVRFVAAARATGRPGRVRRTVILVFLIGTAASAAIAVVLVLGLGHFLAVRVYHSQAVAGVIALAAVWIGVNALLSLTAETFRGFKRFWPATLYGGLAVDVLLVLGFGPLWIAGVRPSLAQAVGLTVAMTGVALAVGMADLWRTVLPFRGEGTAGLREVTAVSVPLLISNIANFAVGTGVDLWVVGHFSNTSDVALYGAASRLVFFVATPLIVVSQVVPPIIAELHARGERDQLERTLRGVSTVAGLPAALVLVAFIVAGGFILSVAYGPYFRGAATVLVILSVARLTAVCTGSSGVTLMMTGHQRTMMLITVGSGAFALVAEILLAPRYGITGVAAATCTAQIMLNLLQLVFARIHVGIWTHARFSLDPVRELVRG
ncbi:MAG TPA: oligosaccharide flippase family protein [Gaiellales bacterium]|nr:oligosaccharide flippase family protein [Gaiellales bacterium]